MQPKITKLDFTYKRPDTDTWVLNLGDIPVDRSKIKDQQLARMAPGAFGGNHKHSRTEWFVAVGELVFFWLDSEGNRHQEEMNPSGQLLLIEVPPFLPHSVLNQSKDQPGILFELSDVIFDDDEDSEVKVEVYG